MIKQKPRDTLLGLLLIPAFLLMALILGFLRMTIDLGLENVTDAFARLLGVE